MRRCFVKDKKKESDERKRSEETIRRIFSPTPEEKEEDRRFLDHMRFWRTLWKPGARRFS
jgi:hypothetical protein